MEYTWQYLEYSNHHLHYLDTEFGDISIRISKETGLTTIYVDYNGDFYENSDMEISLEEAKYIGLKQIALNAFNSLSLSDESIVYTCTTEQITETFFKTFNIQ